MPDGSGVATRRKGGREREGEREGRKEEGRVSSWDELGRRGCERRKECIEKMNIPSKNIR